MINTEYNRNKRKEIYAVLGKEIIYEIDKSVKIFIEDAKLFISRNKGFTIEKIIDISLDNKVFDITYMRNLKKRLSEKDFKIAMDWAKYKLQEYISKSKTV